MLCLAFTFSWPNDHFSSNERLGEDLPSAGIPDADWWRWRTEAKCGAFGAFQTPTAHVFSKVPGAIIHVLHGEERESASGKHVVEVEIFERGRDRCSNLYGPPSPEAHNQSPHSWTQVTPLECPPILQVAICARWITRLDLRINHKKSSR